MKYLPLAGLLLLMACASSPTKDVDYIAAGLTTAADAADAYVTRPPCKSGGPAICSSSGVVRSILKAQSAAMVAFNALQTTYTADNLAKAQAALTALQAIVTTAAN